MITFKISHSSTRVAESEFRTKSQNRIAHFAKNDLPSTFHLEKFMRKHMAVAMTAAGATLLGSLAFGIPSASAANVKLSGTVYDNSWSHYSIQRCATRTVRFDLTSAPDDDVMYHYASRRHGGGGSFGTVRTTESGAGGDSFGRYSMGLSSGCFYWNSRQQEGTFETDREDVWYGELDY